jgi:hypothetical protein
VQWSIISRHLFKLSHHKYKEFVLRSLQKARQMVDEFAKIKHQKGSCICSITHVQKIACPLSASSRRNVMIAQAGWELSPDIGLSSEVVSGLCEHGKKSIKRNITV